MPKTIAQSIIEALLGWGVDVVFGMPGAQILALYSVLATTPIRHITVKHENNGAIMADVYGRLTGKPGILITTAGPGATNALSGIAGAYNAASPLIHISGSVNRGAKSEGFHGSRSEDSVQKVFEPVTKWSFRLERPEQLPTVLSKAFELSTSKRPGPVHIEIPWDLFKAGPFEMEETVIEEKKDQREKNISIFVSIAKILEEASYPVICAGKGVLVQGGQEVLQQFAEVTGMPVITHRNTSGIFPENHPLFAGFLSDYLSHPFAIDNLGKADVLLVIGFGANTEDLELIGRYGKGRRLFIGFDSSDEIDPDAELGVVEDSRWALEKLLTLIRGGGRSWDPNINISRAMEGYNKRLDTWVESYRHSKPLHFGCVLKELTAFLESDSLVVVDVGNHSILARILLPLYSQATILQPGTYAGMGFSIPGAIAAKLVHPSRKAVGVTGDGCFLLSCSDFITAVEQKLPLVLVILNDSHYGMIRYIQLQMYGQSHFSEIGPVDFVKFAESCGGIGFRVEELSELKPTFEEAFSARVPAVIDAVSGPDFPYPPFDLWRNNHK